MERPDTQNGTVQTMMHKDLQAYADALQCPVDVVTRAAEIGIYLECKTHLEQSLPALSDRYHVCRPVGYSATLWTLDGEGTRHDLDSLFFDLSDEVLDVNDIGASIGKALTKIVELHRMVG